MKIVSKQSPKCRMRSGLFQFILVGITVMGVHFAALGQQPASAPAKAQVRVRNLPRMGRAALVRTPNFQSDARRASRISRNREWGSFDITYETAPEWLDEITFNFYVMTQDNKRQYNFFEASVTYIDVEKGQHNACVMLPPAAIARYGEPTAFGVEVILDGEKVAVRSVGPADEWWTMIADKPNISRRPGYLVDRSKTPFGMAFIDDYEVVR